MVRSESSTPSSIGCSVILNSLFIPRCSRSHALTPQLRVAHVTHVTHLTYVTSASLAPRPSHFSPLLASLDRGEKRNLIPLSQDVCCVLVIHPDGHQGRFFHGGKLRKPSLQLPI